MRAKFGMRLLEALGFWHLSREKRDRFRGGASSALADLDVFDLDSDSDDGPLGGAGRPDSDSDDDPLPLGAAALLLAVR